MLDAETRAYEPAPLITTLPSFRFRDGADKSALGLLNFPWRRPSGQVLSSTPKPRASLSLSVVCRFHAAHGTCPFNGRSSTTKSSSLIPIGTPFSLVVPPFFGPPKPFDFKGP